MKPLALTIEGLTSFREPQTIDFSGLDLFVITGPTGSGKSSILDAITFALYGKVARVNAHELRELISHGSAYMRVQLDFEVDRTRYRVARRMSRRAGSDVTLERIEDGVSITEVERGGTKVVNERLEEIVGLDFGSFTKAVLLPQGAFHEFLKGEKAERRRILTRLLDLDRYERVAQAARREADRLQVALSEQRLQIETNYLDATEDRLEELRNVAKLATDHHEQLAQARNEVRKLAKAAAEASQASAILSDGVRQLEEARADLERLERAWAALQSESDVAEQTLARAGARLADAKQQLEEAERRLAATLEATGGAAHLSRLAEAARSRSREQQELAVLEDALARAQEEAAALVATLEDAKRDERAKRMLAEQRSAARQLAENKKELAARIADAAERAAALAAVEKQLASKEEQARALEERAEQARAHCAHLEQEHAAVSLRSRLAPGDTCLVCGSIIERLPTADPDIEALLAQARSALEQAEKEARDGREKVVALSSERRAAANELERAQAVLPAEAEIPDLEQARSALVDATRSASEAAQAAVDAEAEHQRAVDFLSGVKAQAAGALERLNGLTSARDAITQRLEEAETVLAEGFSGELPSDVAAAIEKRLGDLGAAERAREEANKAVETARTAFGEAQAARAIVAQRVADFDGALTAAHTAARIACEAIARSLGQETLPPTPNVAAERTEMLASWRDCCTGYMLAANAAIEEKANEISAAITQLRDRAAKVGITTLDADPDQIEDELDRLVADGRAAAASAEKDVETMTTRIEQRREIEARVADQRHQLELLEQLTLELRADRFVAWVLEESMNQLADQASIELLRISGERYSLVAEGGSFDVVDHHNADEKRSVATLSGGETFLASLSLALALSVGLQELAGTAVGRLEAIYIDEGFGALDPETLEIVVDALERLREGDRMVGVITHVPTLAERIPTGLVVEKHGGASRISTR